LLAKIQKKYNTDKILYIGDEPRDIIASKAVKIKIAAVTWGYSNKKLLAEYNPDFIIDRPQEILKIIKKL
jgi:phosphoglycolate phosphatase